MTDKIAEIRTRHSKRSEIDQSGCYRLDGFTYKESLAQSQEDVATLLAEVERLRAENERLRAEIKRARALLKDPNAVAINMMRGVIALPSAGQIRHIYQQALEAKP